MRNIIQKFKEKGISNSYKILCTKVWDKYFDAKYNIETNTIVTLNDLDLDDDKKEHAYWYVGTKVLPLKALFKKLNLPKDQVLIDIGSGKGRVLLIAAEYGFKTIKGIELSSNLCAIAEKNIASYKNKAKKTNHLSFEIINEDALEYKFSDDETIFFLYNPFDAHLLKEVLMNIKSSLKRHKREITIIYTNPVHRDVIETNMTVRNTKDINLWNVSFIVYDI